MNEVMQAVAKDDPLLIAWEAYKKTPSYGNALTWAQFVSIQARQDGNLAINHPHTEGSLWGVFMAGFNAAKEHANNG